MLLSQLMKLYSSDRHSDLVVEVLCYFLLIMIWSTKYVAFYAIVENVMFNNSINKLYIKTYKISCMIIIVTCINKLREFRKRARNNWSVLMDDREISIMCKYASVGRIFTIIIACKWRIYF